MKFLRYILFPVVPIYYAITWLRNVIYDKGLKPSASYDFPVICVGNLSVGGTGKTPMIEYLIRLLQYDYKLATLSRGYKRETEGFKLANHLDSAKTLGDEPFQFYSKFKNTVLVAVDSDRQNGIQQLKSQSPTPEIVLLDDAFQHRKVKAGLYILLTTYDKLYCDDIVLPTGDLREPKQGAKRAQIIVVTKCPSTLQEAEKAQIVKRLKPEAHQEVFFSSIGYADNIVSSDGVEKPIATLNTFTLITGIANPKPLIDFLQLQGLQFNHLNFKDHYAFTENDIKSFEKLSCIVTTEKDFMRLKQYDSLKDILYYLPIETEMNEQDKMQFDTLVKKFVKR
ncbi:tetraacyldisaccharide 4'-kinase [Corallibacter sp.]|uniref:tetraacyldisaccharide 4'-kinase n=1 Tax=Corallibacter sp. TaxID=2038084 RepID=UPI003AB7E84F